MLASILFVSCGGHKQTENADGDSDFAFEEPHSSMDAEESTKFSVTTDDLATSEESHSGSSTNWDKVLDDYEHYVDKYIALQKKAQKGDMGAMSEYMEMYDAAEQLASQMENGDNMNTAQVARYVRINKKMATAAASMSSSASKKATKASSWLDDDDDDDDDDWF